MNATINKENKYLVVDYHGFFDDEIINENTLIEYAEEERKYINDHLYEEETPFPKVTNVQLAIDILEFNNFEVKKIEK